MTAVRDSPHPASIRYGAVAALAASAFVYFTAETLPVGLLPQISAGLHVSPASVGLLVTIYAAVAAAGAIPLTNLTMRIPRHLLLTGLVLVYVVSQGLASVAPTFTVLILARVICALAHGVFWSVMAPVAAGLAPPGQGGRASSLVMAGNTAGMVLGVPLSTILGQSVGWRDSYGVLALAGIVAAAALFAFLPKMPVSATDRSLSIRGQFGGTVRLAFSRAITPVCIVTTLAVIGQYAAYTYIAPIVQRTGDLHGTALSLLLLGYGVTGLVANVVIGRIVDRRPGVALVGCLAAVAVTLGTLSVTHSAAVTIVAVLVWGAGFAAVPLILQITAMRVAPGRRDSASAIRQTAMQLGIAGGSLVGGLIYRAGHLDALAPFGAVVAAAFVIVVLLTRRTFPFRVDETESGPMLTGPIRTVPDPA
ncbi:MFS transporter [Frondihabitans cladoniiphilus]|uniref:MFS transporter n=1 Tax=Frondihabitans cladoniiphilus TaxID=715785 RepID=A0ABP8VUC4_9MICO